MIIRAATYAEQSAIEASGDVLVADVEGKVAGFAALDGGELRALGVEPEFRNRGIGTALVEACVHQARRLGLSLTANAAAAEEVQFLERRGFSREGEAGDLSGATVRLSR